MKDRNSNKNQGRDPELCSLLRRLAAMVYDTLVLVALLLLATAAAMLAGFRQVTAGEDVFFTLYLLLVWFLYLAWSWRRGGMTVGMRAWRLLLETNEGGRPGWWQCLARFLLSFVSAACVGLGFAWSLVDPMKRTWHDMGSRTRLLRR